MKNKAKKGLRSKKNTTLDGLSSEQLIKIIQQKDKIIEKQKEIIDEHIKKDKKTDRLTSALQQRVEELEVALGQAQKSIDMLTRASKRQAAPFRISEKKRKKHQKRPGRKKGHRGNYRPVPPIVDYEIEVSLSECPHCKGPVSDLRQIEQYIEEIPVPRKEVTRLLTYHGTCNQCGVVQSNHPLKVSNATGAAKCHLGPRAQAMAIQLLYDYSLTLSTTSRLMNEVYGLDISRGGLAQLSQRIGNKCQSTYEHLIRRAAESEVIHADETSWYVGTPKSYLWFFGNSNLAVYKVSDNRSRENVYNTLGKTFAGVLVSDCYAVYDDVNELQQKCYAHHLKEISLALEMCDQGKNVFIEKVRAVLKAAMVIKPLKPEIHSDQYKAMIRHLEQEAADLLAEERSNPIEEKIAKRLRKQQDHLFTFLHHDQVDATNNLAERMLRPAVISRKISCGNKTKKGAQTWQILTSVINTNRLRGISNSQYFYTITQLNNQINLT